MSLSQSGLYHGPVFDMARRQFDHVADHLDIALDERERIFMPKRAIAVSCPIHRDDGSVAVFNGYRVQHHLTLGPTKGGTRFAPSVDVGEVGALAIWMSWKCALVGLPYGGGKPDEAYPTMMRLLPPGLLGLVFAALIAAIIASTASKINSIATIFTLDLYAKRKHLRSRAENEGNDPAAERHLVLVGRMVAVVAILLAIVTARPLLANSDQAFQYIQEYTGFFTPGIVVIFLLGLFWSRASETGAITAAITSFLGSLGLKSFLPSLPFMDRMALVFLAALVLAVILSVLRPQPAASRIETGDIDYTTSRGFNIAAVGVIGILVALYATWW